MLTVTVCNDTGFTLALGDVVVFYVICNVDCSWYNSIYSNDPGLFPLYKES